MHATLERVIHGARSSAVIAHDQRDSSEEGAATYDSEVSKEDTEQRIGHLKLVLEHADVVGEDPNPTLIDPGERVTVWNIARRRKEQFDLRGGEEVINERPQLDDKGPTSVAIDSPVGKALLGRRVGDVITVEIPDGTVRYTVRKIERIPSK